MVIRPLEQSDLEPLHGVYTQRAARIAHHPRVTFEQFAEELVPGPGDAPEAFLPDANAALVAVRAGEPVAMAIARLALKEARGYGVEANAGLISFVLGGPREEDACRQLIQAATEHLKRYAPDSMRALVYPFGPHFHNTACAMLPSQWPWIGHWLRLEGFEVLNSEIRMRKALTHRPEPLLLPEGCELVPADVDAPPELLPYPEARIDGEVAGQCECYYEEYFVRGAGRRMLYTKWLGVEERFRGIGLGRKLLRRAQTEAFDAGARAVTLTTRGENFRAQALYLSEGYVQTDSMRSFREAEGG